MAGLTRIALYIHILLFSLALHGRVVIDMYGRKVTLPDTLRRVIPYDNKTNVLLYPLAGEKMVARARWMRASYFELITPTWMKLREIDTRQAEEVMKLRPEAIIVGAFLDDRTSIEGYIAFAERVNIPLVVVDIDLMRLDKTINFLVSLLGRSERSEALTAFIRDVYHDVATLPPLTGIRPKVYMANDPNGLRTAPRSSRHAQLFDILQVDNVVRSPLEANGFAYVSIEQLLLWQPEYILCVGKGEVNPYRTVLKSALWRSIPAVRQRKVYYVPEDPYSWFDIPPSANRLAGLIWFMELFRGQAKEVTERRIKEFYRLFYGYELSEKEYWKLFEWR
ncbi:MAG: ABC transporter substrate-binding protein [Tannerellaceae bacterium]|jgi:iron complex transport system substrate-binding protein|nr:ABC transporter substrate-binding protein [Tannerellaceae bacterium]